MMPAMKFRLPACVFLFLLSAQASAGFLPSNFTPKGDLRPVVIDHALKTMQTRTSAKRTIVFKGKPVQKKTAAILKSIQDYNQSKPKYDISYRGGEPEGLPIWSIYADIEAALNEQIRNSQSGTPEPTNTRSGNDARPAPQKPQTREDDAREYNEEEGKEEDEQNPPPQEDEGPDQDMPPAKVIPVDDMPPGETPPLYPPVETDPPTVAVPEPGTTSLILGGLALLAWRRKQS